MAISSTITGIALRVIFNQMRQDPIEVEHSARQELAEASRRVRTQLDETVLAFNHFRIQTVQSLEEAQEALLKGVLSEDGVVARVAKPIEVGADRPVAQQKPANTESVDPRSLHPPQPPQPVNPIESVFRRIFGN